jgi:CheY-like chemotaxis protein
MPETRLGLLIVDDEPSLRTSLSLVLGEFGYDVRTAENGFSALSEMRRAVPDILISDLNMPGMSGFELLSIVRRRFPAILVIAMSGAFVGSTIPDGIPTDGFYQKGSGVDLLLKAITGSSSNQRMPRTEAPIWIAPNGHDSSGDAYTTLACPECLRTFPHQLGNSIRPINSTDCIHCGVSIPFAIAGECRV